MRWLIASLVLLVATGCSCGGPGPGTMMMRGDAGPRSDVTYPPGVGEDCGNGLDDDGDGRIDCDDTECLAPTLDPSAPSDFVASYGFLFRGASGACAGHAQRGYVDGAIAPALFSVVRGRVVDRDTGAPIANVRVFVQGEPDLGEATTQADGIFDLAVNAGTSVLVSVALDGYVPLQRALPVPPHDFAWAGDLALSAIDPAATPITFGQHGAQVHQASVVVDDDGTRRATLVFPSGVTAMVQAADGTVRAAPSLTFHATELTVGELGPDAMPALLPDTTSYTYGVEVSADGVDIQTESIRFSSPVSIFVDNFLHFPVGTVAPLGTYDRRNGTWTAERNGRVVRVVGVDGGRAQIDVNGDGSGDSDIPSDVRQGIGGTFAAGTELMWVQVNHFTFADINWGHATPPDGARSPGDGDGDGVSGCHRGGSIIDCENMGLGEIVPLAGGGALAYRSTRAPGYRPAWEYEISRDVGTDLGLLVRAIRMTVDIAGRHYVRDVPLYDGTGNIPYPFVWDGTGAYGPVPGTAIATIQLSYEYDANYRDPGEVDATAFDDPGTTVERPLVEARAPITLTRTFRRRFGNIDPRITGVGGWTLTSHHFYDRTSESVWLGNGEIRDFSQVGVRVRGVRTATGAGTGGFLLEDGTGGYYSVAGTTLLHGHGHPFVEDVVAGNSTVCQSAGDGGPATAATLCYPGPIARGPDGTLYLIDSNILLSGAACVRHVDSAGIIRTIAGVCGEPGEDGDGGPATSAHLGYLGGIAVGPDGTIYLSSVSGNAIRRIAPDGTISRYAGGGAGFADGMTATSVALDAPGGLAVDGEGRLIVAEAARIFRIVDGPRGAVVRGIVGDGVVGSGGDGVPAVRARVHSPTSVIWIPGGEICFAQPVEGLIRCIVGEQQIVHTVAGGGSTPLTDSGYWARGVGGSAADLRACASIARSPHGGLLLGCGALVETTPVVSLRADGNTQWPSADGSVLYVFDAASGRHLETLDATLGTPLLTFQYDTAGRLVGVTDDTGHVLTVARDADEAPTSITGPFGQVHALTTADGWIQSITDPLGGVWSTPTGAHFPGMLDAFTPPDGETSNFTYVEGRLNSDQAPMDEGGHRATVTLQRTLDSLGTHVTVQGPRPGQREVYDVNASPNPFRHDRGTTTSGQGQTRVRLLPNGDEEIHLPTGTVVTQTPASDPRLGDLAAYVTTQRVQLPSGRSYEVIETRDVAPDDDGETATLPATTVQSGIAGHLVTHTWDPSTRTATSSLPSGLSWATVLDDHARVVEQRAPGLEPLTYEYDGEGFLRRVVVGTGTAQRVWSYTYDHGALATATDPLMRTTTVMNDAIGRPMSATGPDGRVVALAYDSVDRLTSVTPPGRGAYTMDYGAAGALRSITPPTGSDPGSVVTITPDDVGDPATRTQGTGVSIGYMRRPEDGQMAQVTLRRGVFRTEFDAQGMVHAFVGNDGQRISYDRDGEVMTGLHVSGGPVSGDLAFEWTADTNQVGAWSVNGTRIDVSYDVDGAPTTIGDLTITRDPTTGFLAQTDAAGVTMTTAANTFGEPDTRRYVQGGTTLYDYTTLSRDALGRITQARETIQGVAHTWTYHYDASDRLDEVRRDGAVVETYSYHPNGARLTYSRQGVSGTDVVDVQERVSSHDGNAITYRADGAVASRATATGAFTYDIDEVGTLLGVTLPDGRHVTYDNDPIGRRVGRRVDGALVAGFLYGEGALPTGESDASGALTRVYVYGGGTGLAPEYIAEGAERYRLVTDIRGSVRLVVRASDGAVVQAIDYDTYGRVTRDTAPGFQPFGYAGGLYDPDTGLVRFGARDYDAELGRWLTPDPSRFDGGMNPYEYVGGDPVNRVDPTGEIFVAIIVPAILMTRAVIALGHGVAAGSCVSATEVIGEFVTSSAVDIGIAVTGEVAFEWAASRFAGWLAGACRGGMCCSFAEETSIETEAGPQSMADLAPGDRVWALDEDTGAWGFHEVLDVTVHPGRALALELIDEEAGASDVLVVTDNHPLYERTRGWTQVGDLLPGDEVFTSRGGWARIGAGTWLDQEQLLYDLEVEGAHTYFVGETGAWAHNCIPSGYSVAYETSIPARGIGTRGSHFRDANANLMAAMDADPAFDQLMESIVPGVREAIEAAPAESPIWTWHHVPDRPGILQLVPRSQHAGAGYGRLFHPDRVGGFKIWGALY